MKRKKMSTALLVMLMLMLTSCSFSFLSSKIAVKARLTGNTPGKDDIAYIKLYLGKEVFGPYKAEETEYMTKTVKRSSLTESITFEVKAVGYDRDDLPVAYGQENIRVDEPLMTYIYEVDINQEPTISFIPFTSDCPEDKYPVEIALIDKDNRRTDYGRLISPNEIQGCSTRLTPGEYTVEYQFNGETETNRMKAVIGKGWPKMKTIKLPYAKEGGRR